MKIRIRRRDGIIQRYDVRLRRRDALDDILKAQLEALSIDPATLKKRPKKEKKMVWEARLKALEIDPDKGIPRGLWAEYKDSQIKEIKKELITKKRMGRMEKQRYNTLMKLFEKTYLEQDFVVSEPELKNDFINLYNKYAPGISDADLKRLFYDLDKQWQKDRIARIQFRNKLLAKQPKIDATSLSKALKSNNRSLVRVRTPNYEFKPKVII